MAKTDSCSYGSSKATETFLDSLPDRLQCFPASTTFGSVDAPEGHEAPVVETAGVVEVVERLDPAMEPDSVSGQKPGPLSGFRPR